MKFAWKVANRWGTADDILAMFQIPDGLRPLIFQRWKPRGCASDIMWGKWPACLHSANQFIRPPPPATRSLFSASFCYEVKIIDWEHREPSRRQRVRRGGAQGEKQIDKKGIKKQGGKRMWAGRGMEGASTGEDGEWKNALTCHSEVWVYRKGRWEQKDDGKISSTCGNLNPFWVILVKFPIISSKMLISILNKCCIQSSFC